MAPQSTQRIQQVLAVLDKANSKKSVKRIPRGDAAIVTELLRTSAASRDPLKGSKNALDAKIAAILASNAPDSVKQNALKQSAMAPKKESWWEQALNVLGKPKSAVVASIGRLADSDRNLLKDIQRNVGVADLVKDQYWHKILPGPLKFATNFIGDVALDPLTYLAGAGAVTKVARTGGAASLAFNASAAAKAAGSLDKAAELASIGQKAAKGLSRLSTAEKTVISDLGYAAGVLKKGEKLGGLYLNVPGTGRILGKVTGLPLTQIPVIPQGALSSAVPRVVRGFEEFARASSVGQKAKKYIGGNEVKAAFTNIVRRGNPEQANAAYHTFNGYNLGEARFGSYLRDMEASRSNISKIVKKSGASFDDVTKALGGDVNAAARVNSAVSRSQGIDNFMLQVRNFDDAVVDEAHRLAGKKFIPKIDNHSPTLPGPGVKGGTPVVRRNPFDPAGFEKRAFSKPGETFEGEVIRHPTDVSYGEVISAGPDGEKFTRHIAPEDVDAARAQGRIVDEFEPDELGRSPKQQVDEIAQAKYGPEYQSMYNMNWDEASAAQVRGVANRMRGEVIKNHLRAKGVSKDLYAEVFSKAARQAQDVLPGLRTELDVLDANAGLVRVLRDLQAQDLKNAQQNAEWVAKESADNVASARQASQLMSEAYRTIPQAVEDMFAEAAAAGVALDNAVLDRKMSEQLMTVLKPDSLLFDSATAEMRKIADVLGKKAASTAANVRSVEEGIVKYTALYKSLDETLKSNWEMANRIDDIASRRAKLLSRRDEIQGFDSGPQPLKSDIRIGDPYDEGLIIRRADPLNPKKKTLAESKIVNNGMAKEARAGKLILTPEGKILADYDGLVAAIDDLKAGTGTSRAVRAAAKELNTSLRAKKLPTIGVGSDPKTMLTRATKILQQSDPNLIKKPNAAKVVSRVEGIEIRKINRELKSMDKELDKIKPLSPRETLSDLMIQRDLMADTVEQLGVRLPEVTTKADDARMADLVNTSKIQDLRNKTIATSNARRQSIIQEKIDVEIGMRETASRLRKEALDAEDRVRVTREQVMSADNEALQAEMVAMMEIDKAKAGVARLEAMALQSEADLARLNRRSTVLEKKIEVMSAKENETVFKRALDDGFARLDMTTQAPDQIVEALMQMAKLQDPKELGNLMKTFDAATRMFKSWAILTPGFHVRNFMGGVFNNYLAGMDFASYRGFIRSDRIFAETFAKTGSREQALKAIARQVGQKEANAYRIVDSSAALKSSGQIGSASGEIGVGSIGMSNKRGFDKFRETLRAQGSGSFVTDNPFTRINYMSSERVERTLRGSLAYDVAMKGGDEFAVLDDVYKFHFNYEDLSSIEQRYMKRISPFYTWSRRNVPLQVEMLFQKPGIYANIGKLKDNIEEMSPTDDLVPAWFSEVGGFRIPFTNPSGERLYMMPDLPPLDLRKVVNPQEWLGEINPVLKVPFELQFNKQLYNKQEFREGYVPFPEAWNKLGIGAVTDAIGITKTDANGQRVGRDSQMYAIESYMPLLGRLRRLFPSEDKYQRRAVATWASMIFGLGFRANTESDKKGELYRRNKNVESANTNLRTMGYGGYRTLNKDVATSRAPVEGEKSPYLILAEPKYGLPIDTPYTAGTRGQSGNQTLETVLKQIQGRGASSDLVNLINRIRSNSQS